MITRTSERLRLTLGRTAAPILAIGVTGCLIALMAGLISEEFSPDDKTDIAELEINPRVDDIDVFVADRSVAKIVKVDTPPAPPIIEVLKADKPVEGAGPMTGAIPIFDRPDLPVMALNIAAIDKDPTPIVRIPPQMPPRADRSGHCNVTFNVSPQGAPFDVTATYCTQSLFQRSAVRSVQNWKYTPKMRDGQAVGMSGLKSKISFRLADERGNIIPE